MNRALDLVRDWRVPIIVGINIVLLLITMVTVDSVRARSDSRSLAREAVASANALQENMTHRLDRLTDINLSQQQRITALERQSAQLEQQLRDNGIEPNIGE